MPAGLAQPSPVQCSAPPPAVVRGLLRSHRSDHARFGPANVAFSAFTRTFRSEEVFAGPCVVRPPRGQKEEKGSTVKIESAAEIKVPRQIRRATRISL